MLSAKEAARRLESGVYDLFGEVIEPLVEILQGNWQDRNVAMMVQGVDADIRNDERENLIWALGLSLTRNKPHPQEVLPK